MDKEIKPIKKIEKKSEYFLKNIKMKNQLISKLKSYPMKTYKILINQIQMYVKIYKNKNM